MGQSTGIIAPATGREFGFGVKTSTPKPDVIVITGDHSTPATIKAHSWHPVPVMLYSKWCRTDGKTKFSEANCRTGELGRNPTENLMAVMMANAMKLNKFGA